MFLSIQRICVFVFILFFFSGCIIEGTKRLPFYHTTFTPEKDQIKYPKKSPCQPKILLNVDAKVLEKYELIGMCKSKKKAGGIDGEHNNAMNSIRNCACEYGGDLVAIESTNEVYRNKNSGIVEYYNINNPKKIIFDETEAKIYRLKTN